MAWDLLIDRSDLAATSIVEIDEPVAGAGQALLRVDRVGMTANNITYALFGDAMQYWDFFPAAEGKGRVPLWGFADVVSSQVPGLAEGTRLYGYLPTSSHLVVQSDRLDDTGFSDASAHRQPLPSPYNRYALTSADPGYDPALEGLQVLFRPLFMTSLMLADFLTDNALFGGSAVVLSSASSKTSYGTAFLLEGAAHRVGLTSAGNVAFTESLGCYDQVVAYDDVATLAKAKTVYVDVAGNQAVRRAVHEHLGDDLVHSAVVGAAHGSTPPAAEDRGGRLPGAKPAFFFAPEQMRKRTADWGPGGLDAHHSKAWTRFAPVVAGWVDVVAGEGPEALQRDYLDVLAGTVDPRTGYVVSL